MNTQKEFRSSTWSSDSESSFHITGYAVVFEERTVLYTDPVTGYEYGEVISRNAFDNCDMSDVILRVDHAGSVLARSRTGSLNLTVDEHGLKIDADLSGSPEARNVFEAVKNKLYDKMSFAFVCGNESYDSSTNTRRVETIKQLLDVSIVDFPAYDATEVSARSRFEDLAGADRRSFNMALVKESKSAVRTLLEEYSISDDMHADEFMNEDDVAYHERNNKSLPAYMRKRIDYSEPILRKMIEHRDRLNTIAADDTQAAKECLESIRRLEKQLFQEEEKRQKARDAIANGIDIEVIENYDSQKDEVNMEPKEIEIRSFQKYVSTGIKSMTEEELRGLTLQSSGAVIPTEISELMITSEKYSDLLHRATVFNQSNAGKLKIPVASNVGATWKSELAAVTATDPTLTDIELGGNELMRAVTLSAAVEHMAPDAFIDHIAQLVSSEVIETLEKAFVTGDGSTVPVTGLEGLTWTSGTNAVINASGINIPDLAAGLSMLPQKYARNAVLIMNANTAYKTIGLAKGTTEYAYNIAEAATSFMGKEIIISEHCGADEVFIVDPKELYVRFSMPMTVEADRVSGFLSATTNLRCLTIVDAAWNTAACVKVAKTA